MKLRLPREKRIYYIKTVLRWIVYYIIIILFFSTMNAGTWTKPILLVPAALCIAVNNDLMASAFTGAVCGFLIDVGCGRLFGYNAVLLTVFCVAVSLLFELYLRDKFINFFWINAVVSFIQCCLDFEFYYNIWKYDHAEMIFCGKTLKVWAYTVIASAFVYLLFKLVNNKLMPREHLTIKEIISNNKGITRFSKE